MQRCTKKALKEAGPKTALAQIPEKVSRYVCMGVWVGGCAYVYVWSGHGNWPGG